LPKTPQALQRAAALHRRCEPTLFACAHRGGRLLSRPEIGREDHRVG
jgi:hypothetical protein